MDKGTTTNSNKIFQRVGKECLFFIERNIDDHLVVYKSCRKGTGKAVEISAIDSYWTTEADALQREDISENAMLYFYNSQIRRQTRSMYEMIVTSLPNKLIRLYLRKDGGVTAKSNINGKEAILQKIFINISNMTVNGIWVYGTFNGQQECERIEITEEMTKTFASATSIFNWM